MRRVGVVGEVEFHVRRRPAVGAARLDELEGGRGGRLHHGRSEAETICVLHTFSTRSMKKSRTSFVLVSLAAMLTRPLERFYNQRKK